MSKYAINREKSRQRVLVAHVRHSSDRSSQGWHNLDIDVATAKVSGRRDSLLFSSIEHESFEDDGKWTHPLRPRDVGGLQITAQANNNEPDNWYGMRVAFSLPHHHIELRDAERMAKTLKFVTKRLEALNDRFGYATTIEAYVARVADVIGAAGVFVPETETSSDYAQDRIHEAIRAITWRCWSHDERAALREKKEASHDAA